MKQNKIIVSFATILLLLVLVFMLFDLFFSEKEKINSYKFNIDKYKQIDTTKLCFSQNSEIQLNYDSAFTICISPKDELYVGGNKFLAIFETTGKKKYEIKVSSNISSIAVNQEDSIFIAYKNRIEIFTKKGKLLKTFSNFPKKTHFTSILLEQETILVADAGNKLIYKLDFNGNMLQEIGKKTEKFHGFIIPSPYFDICKGREGQLWAVNTGRHEFTAFDEHGEVFSTWKKTSMGLDGFSGCCNPSHIAMLSNGDFVTSEKGLERIKIHSPNGDFKCLVAGSNFFEKGTKGIDLAIDSKDRIFALDTKKRKILIFE